MIFLNKIMNMYNNITRISSLISQGHYIIWLLWNFNIIYNYVKRLPVKFYLNLTVGLRDMIDIVKLFII